MAILTDIHPARRLWQLLEPCHALIYFAPEGRSEYADAGLRGSWMGYFASRSAAMGAVGAGVVVATFHNFAPRMVERALPDAWSFSTPERVLAARATAASAALGRLLGDELNSPAIGAAADLLRPAMGACDGSARPLYAAHVRLEWPEPPHLALWHAATLLREHRFDGHVAALLVEGLDGPEALITATASGGLDAQTLRAMRGWTEEEWESAAERLRVRGLLDTTGSLTPDGRRLREAVEARTDELATEPAHRLGDGGLARLDGLLRPLVERLLAGGALPFPNPNGVPQP